MRRGILSNDFIEFSEDDFLFDSSSRGSIRQEGPYRLFRRFLNGCFSQVALVILAKRLGNYEIC